MQVNRDQFLEQGYVILRNVIPPALLDDVRAAYEKAVDRQRVLWTRERTGGDPPGGIWETAAQPRLHLSRNSLIDGENPLARAGAPRGTLKDCTMAADAAYSAAVLAYVSMVGGPAASLSALVGVADQLRPHPLLECQHVPARQAHLREAVERVEPLVESERLLLHR